MGKLILDYGSCKPYLTKEGKKTSLFITTSTPLDVGKYTPHQGRQEMYRRRLKSNTMN